MSLAVKRGKDSDFNVVQAFSRLDNPCLRSMQIPAKKLMAESTTLLMLKSHTLMDQSSFKSAIHLTGAETLRAPVLSGSPRVGGYCQRHHRPGRFEIARGGAWPA